MSRRKTFFFFQAEDGIRDDLVTGVQTCALPICSNGTQVNATLKLQDGTNNLGFATFNYTIGQTTTFYTNPASITINDHAAATPYPSTITIASLSGVINKVTATVSNLGHAYVSDV